MKRTRINASVTNFNVINSAANAYTCIGKRNGTAFYQSRRRLEEQTLRNRYKESSLIGSTRRVDFRSAPLKWQLAIQTRLI